MTLLDQVRTSLGDVGFALRRPEEFSLRWRDTPEDPRWAAVTAVLIINAIVGLAVYGLTLGLHGGASAMLTGAAKAPLATGLAWLIGLPALHILNSVLGSRLDARSTFLAALTTVSFGALAMLASVPINWFFSLVLPYPWVRFLVIAATFAGVGICMADVFLRVMKVLEPHRNLIFPFIWLCLVGVIGIELMFLFDLFA